MAVTEGSEKESGGFSSIGLCRHIHSLRPRECGCVLADVPSPPPTMFHLRMGEWSPGHKPDMSGAFCESVDSSGSPPHSTRDGDQQGWLPTDD